jgi:curved DNA-binding protein CbpA
MPVKAGLMDPYAILGIPKDATLEEIKKAFRREAMKWHPDRSDNSAEAKERFHQAAEAYKFLSENYSADRDSHSSARSSKDYRYKSSASGESANHSGSRYSRNQSGEEFADTVFWDAMLDYAIKLAQTGLNESQISTQLVQNGCQKKLAAIIADKAFNIHAHYAASSRRRSKQGTDKSTFKEERLEAELQRAFIGKPNIFLSPRDTIDYYLVVFSEFRQTANSNPFSIIKTNQRLMKVLSFSILFFAAIVLAIDFYPGESEYKFLPDETLLQIPLGILGLMFIWTAYRRLWLVTVIFWPIYLASLAVFNSHVPRALENDYSSLLPIAILCYSPFIFIALFGNYIYFRKAQKVIHTANRLFEDHHNKITWIRDNAGTSSVAVIVIATFFIASLAYLQPKPVEFLDSIDFSLYGADSAENVTAREKIKLRLKEAHQFFEIAESHFNSSSPDYVKASMAYSTAADNGSLLAAYKLGYMHYFGIGVQQNDILAKEYFELAIRTPLAFQPHSLQITTDFLAESYNSLGIMYQNGYGTRRNTKMASEMYLKAVEFGSSSAQQNLASVYSRSTANKRRPLANPSYK